MPVSNPAGLTDIGSYASPTLADIDDDGDLDAFVGNNDGNTLLYRNIGTPDSPVFDVPVSNPAGLTDVGYYASPTFADIDSDGDLDALVGNYDGNTLLYRNTGTVGSPIFAAPAGNFGLTDVGYNARPTLTDIDGDGDLDAFVGNSDGNTLFYRNTGTADSPAFDVPVSNPFGLTDAVYGASPTFTDIDGDGDLDALVGNSEGNTLFYRNTGTADSPAFAAPVTNLFGLTDVGSNASPTLADIDGDGDWDAFVGSQEGTVFFYHNNNPPTGANKTITLNEDSPYAFSATDFGYADAEGSAMVSVRAKSLPASGLLTLSDKAVILNQVIAAASLPNLTFTPAANANGSDYAGFNFSVNDGKLSSVSTNAITFNVTAVNDAPTLTAFSLAVAGGNEDSEITVNFADLQAKGNEADVDGSVSAFAIKAVSSGSLKIGASAETAKTWNVTTNNAVDATHNAYWTPAANANGTLNAFTLVAKDNSAVESGTAIQAMVSVTAVNDAPTLTAFSATVTGGNEDSEVTVNFAALQSQGNEADVDDSVSAFVVNAISSGSLKIGTSANTAIAWNAATNNTVDATHAAYWTPAANANGTLNAFTVTAKDNSGAVSATAVQAQLSVTAVNDASVLTVPTAINYTDTVFDDSFATVTGKLVASDIDSKPLSYGISGGTDNGNGTISQTGIYGVLTVTKTTGAYSFAANDAAIEALAVNANANFTVTASDGSLSNSKTLTMTIAQKDATESVGNDTLTGTSANNKFDGLAGNDIINGLTGADTMTGGLGNDTYVVDNKGDVVAETSTLAIEIDSVNSSVSYILGANVENLSLTGTTAINGTGNGLANTLIGNTARNLLLGNAGNDALSGGAGNDILDGGTGNDVLTGGEGLDLFRFTSAPTANVDTITDFTVVDDTIQLENAIFNSLGKTGVLKAANFVKATAAQDVNDYVVYNPATGALLYDADGSGANATQQIALLGVNLALTSADFGII